jgi:hypothetical protein
MCVLFGFAPSPFLLLVELLAEDWFVLCHVSRKTDGLEIRFALSPFFRCFSAASSSSSASALYRSVSGMKACWNCAFNISTDFRASDAMGSLVETRPPNLTDKTKDQCRRLVVASLTARRSRGGISCAFRTRFT